MKKYHIELNNLENGKTVMERSFAWLRMTNDVRIKNWKTLKGFRTLSALLFLIFFTSCDKGFEDINKNPFSPTTTDIGPLFNNVVKSLQLGWNEQFYMHNEKLYQVTEQGALTAETFQNINIGTEEAWSQYYTALAHIREIEKRFEELEGDPEALNNVKAQLKIITAYKTFRMTDLFGDMPFFEAGKAFESIDFSRPEFDSQEEIYKFLLEELKWAVENMNLEAEPMTASGEPYVTIGSFDTFFNGYLRQWIKFANSLRLRHALRMSEKDPAYAHPIIVEIIDGKLDLIDEGEDVLMMPSDQNWLNVSLKWSFSEHKKLRMGTTMWNWLSTSDDPAGSGIFDPRAKIFFDTNNEGEWKPFPQVPNAITPQSGGIPYQQHRDVSYDFKGPGNIYSAYNYYLVRDERHVPQVILTAAEVHFAKAEIFLRGIGVAQNTAFGETEYTSGVAASMKFWQNVMANSEVWVNKPPILSSGELFSRINHNRISIFNPDNDKLELIYAQRWLDSFRQPWEAFSLLRRTNAVPRESNPNQFMRFKYPPSEAEKNPTNWANQASQMGGDENTTKIWWIP